MKVKTSITLSPDVLAAVDKLARKGRTRSSVIEDAIRAYLVREQRARRDARDVAIINEHADALNAELEGFLEDQADL